MIQLKALSTVVFLGIGVVLNAEFLLPSTASAQTVTLNEAMLARCNAEGISPPACACWFAEMAEAE